MVRDKSSTAGGPQSKGVPGTTAHSLEVNRRLTEEYPGARCSLDFRTPFELLVATVLSAQTTDERVNQITPDLFDRWPTPEVMSGASEEELQAVLRPLGFFRAKARALAGLSTALAQREDGQVPATLTELVALPGVGRKTANVVLGNAFGVPGITVDTHVGRLVRRLGMTDQKDPVRVERALMELWPKEIWTMLCHRLIFHGRAVCIARSPRCGQCVLADICPSATAEP